MGKKKFKQMTKQCAQIDKLRRKAARTENVRARADVKRGRAHNVSGKGEERRAKGLAKVTDSQANADSSKIMAEALNKDGSGAGEAPKTMITGIPDAVTYTGIAVITITVLGAIGFAVKKSMGGKATPPAGAPAA